MRRVRPGPDEGPVWDRAFEGDTEKLKSVTPRDGPLKHNLTRRLPCASTVIGYLRIGHLLVTAQHIEGRTMSGGGVP